jgi:nucleoid-associated protein YgaU
LPSFLPVLPLVLTEDGGRRRRILFTGSDLPQDGDESNFGGGLRKHVEYYPGSSVATAQILGPEEGAIEFSGVFEDRLKGSPGWAVAQATLLDQIRRSGHPVFYEWGSFRRRCLWEEVQLRTLELQRIAYSVRLVVIDHGLGGSTSRVWSALRDIPGVDSILAAVGQVNTVLDILPAGLGGDYVTLARAAMGRAGGAVSSAGQILDTVATLGSVVDPGLAAQAGTTLRDAKRSLGEAFGHAAQLNWKGAAGTAFDAVTGAARDASRIVTGIVRSAAEVDAVLPQVDALAKTATEDTAYVASGEDSLQRIAQRYYGSADAWTRIAEANGKTNGSVEAGEILRIPDAPTPDQQIVP